MTKPVSLVVPGMTLLLGILLGIFLNQAFLKKKEGFATTEEVVAKCGACNRVAPCGCPNPRPTCAPCPPCREPDLSK